MLRLSTAFLLVACMALTGCEEGGGDDLSDVIWTPPLTSTAGGELDFGDVPIGQTEQATIEGVNNTEETINFSLNVDLDAGDGFVASAPAGSVPVEPGDSISYGPRFNPSSTDSVTGSVQFIYGNDVVTFTVRATGVAP